MGDGATLVRTVTTNLRLLEEARDYRAFDLRAPPAGAVCATPGRVSKKANHDRGRPRSCYLDCVNDLDRDLSEPYPFSSRI